MIIHIHPPISIHELGRRDNQEDSLWPDSATADDRLFVLCDGMGGHEHGEVASRLVCDVLPRELAARWRQDAPLTDDVLREALEVTEDALDVHDNGSLRKMGTTLTLVALHRAGITMAHIGDSRIYHIRPDERRILYKSRDHSLVYDLFMAGEISHDELVASPKSNVITRALMPGQERRPRLDIAHATDVRAGDWLVLCSDGVIETVSDTALVDLLASGLEPQALRDRLVALTDGARDNHTAWLVRIADVASEDGDDSLVGDEATSRCNALVVEREFAQPTEAAATAPQRSRWGDFFRKLFG